jgi:hypothetical protein
MAKAPNAEAAERELNADINSAIAATETEIFEEAMGDDPLDLDNDRSLEEMGDGLEGEHLDEGDVADEEGTTDEQLEETAEDDADEEAEDEQSEDDEVDDEQQSEEGEVEEETGPEDQPIAARERRDEMADRRGIPPGRLREESEARRAAERERDDLRYAFQTLEARFNDMQARLNGSQQPQQRQQQEQRPPKPDMFSDPDGYEKWVLEEADRRAEARVEQRLRESMEQQQQREMARVNENLSRAARGQRGFEFREAFDRLTSLDPRDQRNRDLVRGIYESADPASALFEWWEENGGPEYREAIYAQVAGEPAPRQQRGFDRHGASNEMRRQAPARNEVRYSGGQQRRMPPSLNSAVGGGRQQINDPEMLDNSDDAVFRFAMR